MGHFQRLRVNTQTSHTFLTHRPPGCIYRPSPQATVVVCLPAVRLCLIYCVLVGNTNKGSSNAQMWETSTSTLRTKPAHLSVVFACSWRDVFKGESGSWDKI